MSDELHLPELIAWWKKKERLEDLLAIYRVDRLFLGVGSEFQRGMQLMKGIILNDLERILEEEECKADSQNSKQ